MRSKPPSTTGTATSSAVCVAVSWNSSRKRGANALMSPQAAKQTANDRVPQASCSREPDVSEPIVRPFLLFAKATSLTRQFNWLRGSFLELEIGFQVGHLTGRI